MNRHLEHYKLGTLCSVKHGYPFDGSKFADHGTYIVLTPGNFFEKGGFKRIKGKEKYYTGAFPQEYLCSKDDLIVAMTQQAEGLLGSTALVPEDNLYLHNQRIGLVFHNHDLVDKLYLYYLFTTKSVRKQISDSASGTKIKHTSPDKIYSVSVSIPSIDIQRKNALLLYWIDQKIENNSLICSELEALAKTLYNYWFVQFDFPDENGRPYRNSGGEMVWNEQLKREIPKGWKTGNLYDIANFFNGIACQRFRPRENESGLPVIKIKEMHDGITTDTEFVTENIPDKNKVFDGDILFSWSATLEVMYWFGGNGGLNQHIFKVVPKGYFSNEYVYEQLSAYIINFVKMAEARKTTMGHITTDHLEQSRIVLPPEEVIKCFSEAAQPIHRKIGQARQENRELMKLRDWLLPMLMNGQARVE